MTNTLPRQNYHLDCEEGINKQINMKLYGSYMYQSMAFYFDRDDVALHGFHKLFKKTTEEKRGNAEKLMKYQNLRGGRITLQNIEKPSTENWVTGLDALKAALHFEKTINEALFDLHRVSRSHNDVHVCRLVLMMCDFLEEDFLRKQVKSIKTLSHYITNLKRAGEGLGEYMFDKESLKCEDESTEERLHCSQEKD
ncbi:soma ferritin-like isoform X2 [Tachypleus tridentatus]|uniref:soma ferritin-like isoform X2 n=1 Tax=Tachypleus tridentatus TaxID=6853 RepID=UPI003FCF2809